jgi:plastocyanin
MTAGSVEHHRREPLKFKTRDLVIAAAACAVVGIPALAYGQQGPPTVSAVDNGASHSWDHPDITIAPGGTVTFQNTTPTGHNVDFTDKQPTCTQTSGTVISAPPPMPTFATKPWSGTCTFSTPGDYPFICDVHYDMTGVIHVVAPGQPTATATATPTVTPTTTPVASGSPDPGDPPGGGSTTPSPNSPNSNNATPSQLKLSVAKTQTGTKVKGDVTVEKAGSKLAVSVWAAKNVLQHSSSKKLVEIGHATRTKAPAGKLTFSVNANRTARSALRRHRRLSVTVVIALTPPGGHELTRSVKSTLKMS